MGGHPVCVSGWTIRYDELTHHRWVSSVLWLLSSTETATWSPSSMGTCTCSRAPLHGAGSRRGLSPVHTGVEVKVDFLSPARCWRCRLWRCAATKKLTSTFCRFRAIQDTIAPTERQCSRIRILRFFQISKNMTFYVFWVVAHVFSNNAERSHNMQRTLISCCSCRQEADQFYHQHVGYRRPTVFNLQHFPLCNSFRESYRVSCKE